MIGIEKHMTKSTLRRVMMFMFISCFPLALSLCSVKVIANN